LSRGIFAFLLLKKGRVDEINRNDGNYYKRQDDEYLHLTKSGRNAYRALSHSNGSRETTERKCLGRRCDIFSSHTTDRGRRCGCVSEVVASEIIAKVVTPEIVTEVVTPEVVTEVVASEVVTEVIASEVVTEVIAPEIVAEIVAEFIQRFFCCHLNTNNIIIYFCFCSFVEYAWHIGY
jgi:hypothetical protein